MIEQLTGAVADYGALALFLILLVNCVGVPFPTSLLMLAAGSAAAQGQMEAGPVLLAGIAGAVAGDQLGYALGRGGGEPALSALSRRFGLGPAIGRARGFMDRWGGPSVFLTRWLFSPVGPYVNLVAGATRLSWARFTLWGALGEGVWVLGYVGLGYVFSRHVAALAQMLGDFTWFAVFGAAAAFLGWKAAGYLRAAR